MTRNGDAAAPGAGPGLSLRPLTLGDFDAYFGMKCDPDDVRMAGFAGPPDKSGLRRWLERELANADASLLVAVPEDRAGIAGYLFLRRVGARRDAAEISYGVAAAFRGRRYGEAMNVLAIDWVRRNLPGVGRTVCWVARDNAASVKNVLAAGYRDSGEARTTRFLSPAPHDKEMRKYVHAVGN